MTHLYFYHSEHTWATSVQGLAWNCPNGAIRASQVLEGTFTDSSVFVDVRVAETLERHWKSHFFEIIRNVTTDHEEGGRGRRDREQREVEMATTHNTQDKLCDNLVLAFFGRQSQSKTDNTLITNTFFKITQLPIFQIPLNYELQS